LVIGESDQKLRRACGHIGQMRGVVRAHALGQGHKSGAVIRCGNGAERVAGERENIANIDVEAGSGVVLERRHVGDLGRNTKFCKQLLNGGF